MTDVGELFDAFQIPEACLVDRRIPKKRLLDEAPTAADRRRITDGVERVQWRAVLKPRSTGIAGFRDAVREVGELSVLEVELKTGGQRDRTIQLVHRAIPYLLVLLTQRANDVSVSLADKRWSLAEKSKMVLDGGVLTVDTGDGHQPAHMEQLIEHLALTRQPQTSLYSVYEGWINTLVAFRAARHTGKFSMPDSVEHAQHRRRALERIEMLDAEILALRRTANKERQATKRAELNLRLQKLRSAQETELSGL